MVCLEKKKKCCWYKSVWEKVKSFLPLPLITKRKKKKSLRKRKKKSSDLLSQGSQPVAQTEASWEFTVFTIVLSNKDNDIKEVQVPSSLDSNYSSTSNFHICNPDSRFGRSLCLNTDGCWGKLMPLIYNIWMNSSRLEGIKCRNTWKLLYFLSYWQRVFLLLFALESLPQRICIYTCLYQQFFKGKKKASWDTAEGLLGTLLEWGVPTFGSTVSKHRKSGISRHVALQDLPEDLLWAALLNTDILG